MRQRSPPSFGGGLDTHHILGSLRNQAAFCVFQSFIEFPMVSWLTFKERKPHIISIQHDISYIIVR